MGFQNRSNALHTGFQYCAVDSIHCFLDLLLDHPFRQQFQLLRVGTVPASLKLVFVVDFDVSHNYRQLLFMDGIPAIL